MKILAWLARLTVAELVAATGRCQLAEDCGRRFPIYWWVWGQNNSNLTDQWSMEPLTKTQLGGHCSALTPVPKRNTIHNPNVTSEWSEGAWPRLPQNDTAAQLKRHIAALEAQLPHCVPDPR